MRSTDGCGHHEAHKVLRPPKNGQVPWMKPPCSVISRVFDETVQGNVSHEPVANFRNGGWRFSTWVGSQEPVRRLCELFEDVFHETHTTTLEDEDFAIRISLECFIHVRKRTKTTSNYDIVEFFKV